MSTKKATSKKVTSIKKGKFKLSSIIALVLLLAAVIAGLYLVRQNQNMEEDAFDPSKMTCRELKGECLKKYSDNDPRAICKENYISISTSDCEQATNGTKGCCFKPRLSMITTQINIKGGVMIDKSDGKGKNRFTKLECPGKAFKTDERLNVTTRYTDTYTAKWDCLGPNFEFSENRAIMGPYKFTLTPPAGYKCKAIEVKNLLNNQVIYNFENTCTADVTILKRTSSLYIMYKVAK